MSLLSFLSLQRGHVLRVRKPSAHVASAIDSVLWDGVLDGASGYAIHSELQYMSELMAPLLGHEYVFPGVPVPVPEEIQALLLATEAGGAGSGARSGAGDPSAGGFPALIQPDHTTFHAGGAAGYVGVGPAICLEIKPKWGLDPRGAGSPKDLGQGLSRRELLPGGAQSQLPAGDALPPPPPLPPLGTTGSCEFAFAGPASRVSSEASSCPSESVESSEDSVVLRQRYPRYMLHMLYKHIKKGVPITLYNPLDLFSGELERMTGALWRLMQSPSNNLCVFKDGAKVYDGAHASGMPHISRVGASAAICSAPAPQQQQPRCDAATAPLERLAAELQDFVGAAPAGREALGTGNAAAAAVGVAGGVGPAPPAADDAESGGGRPAASQNRQRQQEQRGGLEVLATVVRLTALALQQEGVLGRLQHVQALDEVGAEGAQELYDQLLREMQLREMQGKQQQTAAAAAAATVLAEAATAATGEVEALARSGRAAAAPEPAAPLLDFPAVAAELATVAAGVRRAAAATAAGVTAAAATEVVATAAAATDAAAAAAVALADAGQDVRLSSLRRYLMSATAKDCGIMVTLQRAVRLQSDAAAAALVDAAAAHSGIGNGVRPLKEEAPPPQQQPRQQRPWVRLLVDPCSGVSYMYKVAFVDLDIKAASKIPKHLELEQSLLGCARENLALLRRMASQTGWTF